MRFSSWAVLSVVVLGCSSSQDRNGFQNAGNTPPPSGTNPPTGGFGGPEGGVPSIDGDGCADAAKLVYVFSNAGDLYSFGPADKKFTKIAKVNCQLDGKNLTPNSMAVDRQAVAWVDLGDDNLFSPNYYVFKVDTKTGECTPTKISGKIRGMGFSLDQKATTQETLFATGATGFFGGSSIPLWRIDTQNEKLVKLGDVPTAAGVELTGNADAELYGFVADDPPSVAQIDKQTGELSNSVKLTNIQKPAAFAFSFWGGDFFFYTAPQDPNDPSKALATTVSRYRPSDKSVDPSYMADIGFTIVGAGVSTCAPTTFPK